MTETENHSQQPIVNQQFKKITFIHSVNCSISIPSTSIHFSIALHSYVFNDFSFKTIISITQSFSFSSENQITWIERQTRIYIHHQMYIHCSWERWWHSFGGFMIFCIALKWKLCRQNFLLSIFLFYFLLVATSTFHFHFHFIATLVFFFEALLFV